MNNDQPGRADSTGGGSFDSLFSHDDSARPTAAEPSDDQGRAHRTTDDEAGPGRPFELKFSGDGEATGRRAAS